MRTFSPSTIVTKLLPAFASHSWTALIPFHPIFALGALLKLSPLNKFQEILIVFIETMTNLVLFASHSHMKIAPASQTVMLLACRAPIIIQNFIELKHSWASGCWTPGS
jgi:hypothetical protein